MYPYIVCYCGRSLGDIYDLFKALCHEKYVQAHDDGLDMDIDPSMLAIAESVNVDIGDVFDQLHMHVDCCRARLMSQVEFKEYY